MPKCSHCGKENAWDSKACPSCGKQNPSGCAKLMLALVIIFIIFIILSSAGKH